jgi:ribonucleoside-diphosphate reductase alpha chain
MYLSFESRGLARRKVDAMSLMQRIIQVQTISGGPYMLYKDHINKLSNQQHLGPIRLSNLCTEIVEYTEPDQEIAVCNLVSIALPRFVIEGELKNEFDYNDLGTVVRMAVRSLNRVIDINMYPVESAKNSNLKHRPIGIGVQGLADLFIKLKLPFESEEAIELNRKIFETMYYHAVAESCELAKTHNRYETEQGSPLSKGKFHWQLFEEMTHKSVPLSGMWDWDALRTEVVAHGTRNSLFIAPMPTASTAQILGNSEGLEANQSMIFTRNVLSGEFQVVNTELITHLIKSNQWNEEMRRRLIQNGGSIQNLPVDNETKQLFKTAWEIKQKRVIDMAAARAPFIDQSASLNIYNRNPDPNTMFNIHMYGWKNHLKTGMYYLRSQPGSHANRSVVGSTTDPTTDPTTDSAMSTSPSDNSDNKSDNKNEDQVCRKVEGCLMCGS